nr:MAG: hypothetical protein [Bacteriophage sp.]
MSDFNLASDSLKKPFAADTLPVDVIAAVVNGTVITELDESHLYQVLL